MLWEILSDTELWSYLEGRRYCAGDPYLTGKVLVVGDPEIGKAMFPDASKHNRDYWEDYMLDRGQFAWKANLNADRGKQLWLDLDDVADWEGVEVPPGAGCSKAGCRLARRHF